MSELAITLPLEEVERLLDMATLWSESKDFIEPEDRAIFKLVDREVRQVREMGERR